MDWRDDPQRLGEAMDNPPAFPTIHGNLGKRNHSRCKKNPPGFSLADGESPVLKVNRLLGVFLVDDLHSMSHFCQQGR